MGGEEGVVVDERNTSEGVDFGIDVDICDRFQ